MQTLQTRVALTLGIAILAATGTACNNEGATSTTGDTDTSTSEPSSSGQVVTTSNATSDDTSSSSSSSSSSDDTGSSSSGDETSSSSGSSSTGSEIECGPGTERCGDLCIATALDPANCGGCGNACAAEEACDAGSCVLECNGGSTKCEGSCVAIETDPANCGECGKTCDALQEVCAAGACVPACGDNGLSKCGGACVDTQSDALHCGECENACAGTDACVLGVCVAQTAPKAVYTMSNDPSGNHILAFARAEDGTLAAAGSFTATGGKGTGAGLGNQHGLIFDQAQGLFFAVNAGDNSISMLSLELDGALVLRANVPAGGVRPISVTVAGDVVYVVNAGDMNTPANIAGFNIVGTDLVPIADSTRPLSAANPGPAQIQFSPDGAALVVTEKATNTLVTYTVDGGLATGPIKTASSGQTPFGFDFSANQRLIVSEAWGGQANLSSTSSYSLALDGTLTTVSGAVPTTRTAACWLVVAGTYAYVANAMTNDISGFSIADDGTLKLLNPDGVTGKAGKAPVDEDVTDGNEFLYVVNNGDHSFSIFTINDDGSLTKQPDFLGLPSTASGIVAR
jgi:6-phosphogluconolactonase (cycloisomerase 2 family)